MDLQLKWIRTMRGLSQDDMAARLHIKKSRYGSWERGERMMSLAQAYEVTEILDCTLDELVGRTPNEHRYADPLQTTVNECFTTINADGKKLLAKTAHAFMTSPDFH